MVRRVVPAARLLVDPGSAAALRQGLGQEDMVDAQPQVPLEAGGPVVPPAEVAAPVMEHPETVPEAVAEQALECCTFRPAGQYRAHPGGGVMHVPVVRCDV